MQKKFQAYILNQSSNFCGLIIFLKLNLALPAAQTFLLLQQMLSNLQTEPLSPIPSAPSISSLSSAPLSPSSHDSASNTSPPPDWNRVNGQFHQFNHQNHHHCHQFTIAAIANLDHPCQSPDNLQPKNLPLLLVPMSPISDFFRSARTSRSTLDFRIRGHGQGGHGP